MANEQDGFLSMKLDPVLKNSFKAACSTQGKTMKQVLSEYMGKYVESANKEQTV